MSRIFYSSEALEKNKRAAELPHVDIFDHVDELCGLRSKLIQPRGGRSDDWDRGRAKEYKVGSQQARSSGRSRAKQGKCRLRRPSALSELCC